MHSLRFSYTRTMIKTVVKRKILLQVGRLSGWNFKRIKMGVFSLYTQLLLETDQIFILNDSLNAIKF